MSERSSFISDNLVYFANAEGRHLQVAQELVDHLARVVIRSHIIQHENHTAVAGFISATGPDIEWECLTNLPPFAHNVSLVINSDAGGVCRYNLNTHKFEIRSMDRLGPVHD